MFGGAQESVIIRAFLTILKPIGPVTQGLPRSYFRGARWRRVDIKRMSM